MIWRVKTPTSSSAAIDKYAFAGRMENILSKQTELQKRLSDAEERAHEAADLKVKFEKVLAENELLKQKLEHCKFWWPYFYLVKAVFCFSLLRIWLEILNIKNHNWSFLKFSNFEICSFKKK